VTPGEDELLECIRVVAAELPPATISAVCSKLTTVDRPVRPGALVSIGATQHARLRLKKLEEAMRMDSAPSAGSIALALQAAVHTLASMSAKDMIEIAWTGHGTNAVPVRRVDQVMYELIGQAKEEIILASFVAYGAPNVISALQAASNRGVEVVLILECVEESSGKVSFDALSKYQRAIPRAAIYTWPRECRPVSSNGGRGVFHVKCLLCDRAHALVSSANLTDYGLDLNMELGLVVHDGNVPEHLEDHFRQLIIEGDLEKWCP
jgi:phosphatidylserine/phosphatidylglycerophosphate/cardiolipin synthase-like enzyme